MKQKQKISQIEKLPSAESFENIGNDDKSYKECPYCGQCMIPFKLGVCICGAQVGKIQYVQNPIKFAKEQYYCHVGVTKVEKLEIKEPEYN
jgi:hypothetical protein